MTNAEKYTCAATTECSKVVYFSDACQMFKTSHWAELFQKIHETWENLSKTPINILKTSVWWTENSVNLSGVTVPNLEIKFNYRVKWAFLFLLWVQVALHCWKLSCFQSLCYSFKERNNGWTFLYLLPINNVSGSEGADRTGTQIWGRSPTKIRHKPRHVNAQEQNSF